MALYTLDTASLCRIFAFLDAQKLLELDFTGNSALRAKLRSCITDFIVPWTSFARAPLSSFAAAFNQISTNPKLFRVSREYPQTHSDPGDKLDWNLLPKALKAIEIDTHSRVALPAPTTPFGDLFPALQSLWLQGVDFPQSVDWVPQTLTSLTLYSSTDEIALGRILDHLPPQLAHLVLPGGVIRSAGDPPLNFRHLPLESVNLFITTHEKRMEWSFLPNTCTDIELTVMDPDNGNNVLRGPSRTSFKALFPQLRAINASFAALVPESVHDLVIDFPNTLTSFSTSYYVPESIGGLPFPYSGASSTSNVNGNKEKTLVEFFCDHFASRFGHQIRSLMAFPAFSLSKKLQFFPLLELWMFLRSTGDFDIDIDIDRLGVEDEEADIAASVQRCSSIGSGYLKLLAQYNKASCLKLRMDFFPTSSDLLILPLTVVSLSITHSISTHTQHLYRDIKPSDWPVSLRELDLRFKYAEPATSSQPNFNLSCLPNCLKSISLGIIDAQVRYESLEDEQKQNPFITGSLAHISVLETLYITESIFDRRYIFSSPEDLPSSLTSLSRTHNAFSNDFVLLPADGNISDFRFPNLVSIGLCYWYDGEPPVRNFIGGHLDLEYLQALHDYDQRCAVHGLNTALFARLPPNLTSLEAFVLPSSPKWNSQILASLPRSLTSLSLSNAAAVRFEDDTASSLSFLPPKLESFCFGSPGSAASYPPDFVSCTPPGIKKTFSVPHDLSRRNSNRNNE